jgi:peptide/nickel transport system substrate-binding protein
MSRFTAHHRLWRMVGGCLAVALAVAACSGSSGNPSTSSTSSGSSTSSSAPYLPIAICCAWGATWTYNPFAPGFPGFGNGMVYLPLADQVPPDMTGFVPQLATSWSVSGNKFVINLRTDAKWQDGQPFTSKDVYDTLLLDGTNGGGGWLGYSDVTMPSAHQVELTIRSGTPPSILAMNVLGITPYPASVYGQFVTPTLKQDLITYYDALVNNPATATSLPAYTAIGNAFKTLAAFKPDKMIGDGPFRLDSMNTIEAKLPKWNGFWAASNIHIGGIQYLNGTTNQVMYPQLYSGVAAFSNVYMPPSIVTRWLQTPGGHIALPPSFEFALGFATARYPLNMTAVRQALAYTIPRDKMVSITYGNVDADAAAEPHPDGLSPQIEPLWLTKSQIAQLNTYPVNATKATELLQSVGFHQSNGTWIMPNGQPFTLTMVVNSATSDVVSCFEVAANALTSFGIKTTVNAIPGAETGPAFFSNQGDIFWIGANSLDPLLEFNSYLNSDNFPALGTYKGEKGLGFGPSMDVPGLGTVDVPKTIADESAHVGPGPEMKRLTWAWAQLVNQQVPFLQWQNKIYQFSFSTAKFTNWPPLNKQGTSRLWDITGYNMNAGLMLMMEEGYVRPK